MRSASMGEAVYAATMIALGVLGLVRGDLAAVWHPVFSSVPARETMIALCSFVSLACGVGLWGSRAAALAARVLFAWLVVWFLLFRAPILLIAPTSAVSWENCGETVVILAAAWIIHAGHRGTNGKRPLAGHATGVRAARSIYAFALIAFGAAHFAYTKQTADLVPWWLPAHVVLAYFTGCTYVAAGLAVLSGTAARWAAILAAVQMGTFTFLVWIPIVMAAPTPGQWGELVVSWALTASAWVVAGSYRQAAGPRELRTPLGAPS